MQRRMALTIFATILLGLLATGLEARPVLPITTQLPDANTVSTIPGVFETGNFDITSYQVGTSGICSSPKPLLIIRPEESGTYPIIVFHHGTFLRNTMYTDLLKHISSHGYIVVAPQLYELMPPSPSEELESAATVLNWLSSHLRCVLPENIGGDLEKLSLGGHSRGGYIAFALALGRARTSLKVKVSAIAGIDPVAGTSKDAQLEPKILNYAASSMNLTIPATVVGTGLGDESVLPLLPACAPYAVNHAEFFYECKPPCAHFVCTDYGHMDVLNDYLNPVGASARLACKGSRWGLSRKPMRSSVGAIVVAFLKAYFVGESGDYLSIVQNPSVAPAKLDPVQSKGSLGSYKVY